MKTSRFVGLLSRLVGSLRIRWWRDSPAGHPQPRQEHHHAPAPRPALSATDPVLGRTVVLSVTGGRPNTSGVLFGGLAANPVYFGNGCFAHVGLAALFIYGGFTTDSQGRGRGSLPVPNMPRLVGLTVAMQAMLSSGNAPLGGDLTNGVYLTVGR